MRNLLNPKWLLIINTLPIIILMLIFWGDYNIIKTLLSEYQINLWKNFSLTLLVLTILHLGYTIAAIVKKKKLSIHYAFISLIVYIIFIYLYSVNSTEMIPWDIPRWMLSGDLFLYVGTFLMPTLAHALFIIVIKLTPKDKNIKAWKNILGAIAIPLLCYIFFQVLLPMFRVLDSGFGTHTLIILFIIIVILFLFFLIRGIYILSITRGKALKKYELAWKIPIGIIFPLLGLAVNNGFMISEFSLRGSGIFGDFGSYWFYILALINGILICLPSRTNKVYRLGLFIARSITFAFTLYFFIVFLPYLPLSIFAIIAIGLGFLMLTPLILFVIHVQELATDFTFLKHHFSKQILISVSILGFLFLPACITMSYTQDKMVLHETLDYIYNPDYSKTYSIDKQSLQKTLSVVMTNKERNNNDFLSSNSTPYLSKYFNWMVLDNLTLSDAKINAIERIFFNSESFNLWQGNIRNEDVSITNISSSSTYNTKEQNWTSWIDLEITNANKDNFFSEYATTLNLPDGCWINDYYLYVGDKKEMGILAEKKSAMWVFSQIRGENRDPGLLHYLTGNKVSFRVFPFSKNEVRKTGIQLIHKEPISITIDDHNVQLGDTFSNSSNASVQHKDIAYISTSEKQLLKAIKRKPYYHFVVDISAEKENLIDSYISTIDNFISKHALDSNHKISFTNTYTTTTEFDTNWKSTLKNQNYVGGFYLERAIKKIYYNVYEQPTDSFPIIIAVTDTMNSAVIAKDFKDFKFAFPENNLFYHLNTLGYLASHDLTNTPKVIINDDTHIQLNDSVLAWPNTNKPIAYLPNTEGPDIVLKTSIIELNDTEIKENHWNSGLLMQGQFRSNILHPENSEKDWNTMVKHSFMSQIMTPLTSYIVVENEAQKAILLKKQKEVLAGKKALDLNEDTQRMSEPKLIILMILFGLFLLFKRKELRLF